MAEAIRDAVVTNIADEGDDAKTFRLEFPDREPLVFLPGQHVHVAFPDDPEKVRSFSICSSPLERVSIELTIARRGDVAARMFELKGGETLRVGGPHGDWTYADEVKHAALISSGVGVAPYRSMIRYVLEKGLPNSLALFYCERRSSGILFRRELDEYSKKGVHVHVTLTEPSPNGDAPWDGPTGPLTIEDIRKGVADLKDTAFYLCGSGRLISELRPALVKAGVSRRRILVEKWWDD